MTVAPLALAAALGLSPVASKAPPPHRDVPMSAEEKAFCADELGVVERRARLFQAQGLSAAEIDRRNEGVQQNVAECRQRFGAEQRRAAEKQADLAELERRVGPDATELERQRAWRQLRRERLAVKPASALTADERAELQAGTQEELAATHRTLDTTHARDPRFMRQVHSALACYHGERRAALELEIAHEESLAKVGGGDRTRLYVLRSDLRQSDEVLARSREAARELPDGLARCSEPQTAVLAHCLGIRAEGKKAEPACESEELQQYLRFVR
ncbi:hypothetical protein [Anaeromyxobacter oryzisoli]|uniref:hypothetical protein n=1 Tax=Anaeromyxobacter oryzisoli TaxID=2925408 RepID=UPI001F55BD86|nr:hypothetical protein [Anaeromyxobacter sp. SG63]